MTTEFGANFGEACRRLLEMPAKEKGKVFESLLVHVLPKIPDTEIHEAWRWVDVPNKLKKQIWPRGSGTDIGVDIIAQRKDGGLIAIQAKCYQPEAMLPKQDVDSFLATTGGREEIAHRWIIATCRPTNNLLVSTSKCTFIHAPSQWGHVQLSEGQKRTTHDLDMLQTEAFGACVEGLKDHDRGQLIMACGTGKTLVSQRVAEKIVPVGGIVIYATPSIGLTAQSRREWLREARRPIQTVVVCSDQAAGKGGEETGYAYEIEAPVSTNPTEISTSIKRAMESQPAGEGGYTVIFTTYQSMDKVCEAQKKGVPEADFVIADEAHKTAGVIKGNGEAKIFQKVHRDLKARKRLYQTATPRIYSRRSKKRITDSLTTEESQVEIIDMSDDSTYGPELYRLRFTEALQAPRHERRLCDYRVVVVLLDDTLESPATGSAEEVRNTAMGQRMAGLALVMHGVDGVTIHEGRKQNAPIRDLSSCIAFCNQLRKAKWARKTIADERLTAWVRQRASMPPPPSLPHLEVNSGYLDGRSDAIERYEELERLRTAAQKGRRHVTTNVKVLSEGINVPALDAICFLEERSSEIDIVQAVGRVMRRPPDGNKEFGYIIVPVMMNPQLEFEETLSEWNHDWRVLGQVLRSLRAHDERIETELQKQIIITTPENGGGGGDGESPDFWERLQRGDYDGLVPAVMELSGLKPDVKEETNLIKSAVDAAARSLLQETGLGQKLRRPAGIEDVRRKPDHRACAASALLLTNALLMHQRINETTSSDGGLRLTPLSKIKKRRTPEQELKTDWHKVLEVDYRPIFEPALEVLKASLIAGETAEGMRSALRTLARHCEEIADIYARMGMDHAGELFQAAMDHPDADGAYYTLTPGAMLLAELACDARADEEDPVWGDVDKWREETILDPACGSGTLLTAMATAIKRRASIQGTDEKRSRQLHAALVEDSLTGLDINARAVQIAASQLAVAIAGHQIRRMGLWTMPRRERGIMAGARLGTLELLETRRDGTYRGNLLKEVIKHDIEGAQIDIADAISTGGGLRERLMRTGICISNPPYSNSAKEAGDLTPGARREISTRKKHLRELVAESDPGLEGILNPNSVSPWFSALMEELVDQENGVIAKIMPTTACTSIGGEERIFWASRFDVLLILTIHNPRAPNWSAETDVTESMMVMCRRDGTQKPTRFISLSKRPTNTEEVRDLHQRIAERKLGEWGRECEWPQERMAEGDWSPAVWYYHDLAEAARVLEELTNESGWTRIGDAWGDVKTTKEIVGKEKWEWCEENEAEVLVLKGAGMDAQKRIEGIIDGWARRVKKLQDKESVLQNLVQKASHLHITNTQDSMSARLNTVVTSEMAVGYTWTPVQNISREEAEAVAVWNNSTMGRIGMRKWGSRKITWPMYQPKAISRMVVPDISGSTGERIRKKLQEAFALTKEQKVSSYRDGVGEIREIWDDAVSEATGLDRKWIAKCAELLAEEPTIKGKTNE